MRGRLTREYKGRQQIYVKEGDKRLWRYAERRDCPVCHVEFLHPTHNKGPRQGNVHYCSPACRNKGNVRLNSARRTEKQCLICGTTFKVKPSHAARHTTCSEQCRVEYQRQRKLAWWQDRRSATI